MIFQVTGLPRSGTGFMTVFFNFHPFCYAHHDVAADQDGWQDWSAKMSGLYTFVGEVSTYGWLPKATREGPKIFIERDPAEVVQSLHDKLDRPFNVGDYIVMQAQALRWADEHGALIIPFEHLFTIPVLERIWRYIFGSFRFPVEKVQVLISMNIQRQHPERMLGNPAQARERLFA